jgi:hypothetical protein
MTEVTSIFWANEHGDAWAAESLLPPIYEKS